RLFLMMVSCIFVQSCSKNQPGDCFKSSGEVVQQERLLSSFNKLVISDRFNIILSQDSSKPESAVLRGGKSLLSSVVMHVIDTALYIKDGNTCNWVRNYDNRITIELNIHKLKKLYIHDDVYLETNEK